MKHDKGLTQSSPQPMDFIREIRDLRDRLDRLLNAALASGPPVTSHSQSWRTESRVRLAQKLRVVRLHLFGEDLFADPAWDIFLDLYAAHLGQQRTSVSSLCLAAGVPPTTALRWIKKLEHEGWIDREADTLDGRRYFLTLSPRAISRMERYMDEAAGLMGSG